MQCVLLDIHKYREGGTSGQIQCSKMEQSVDERTAFILMKGIEFFLYFKINTS